MASALFCLLLSGCFVLLPKTTFSLESIHPQFLATAVEVDFTGQARGADEVLLAAADAAQPVLSKPKPVDKYCSIIVSGSTVTGDFDISGIYEHLKGVVLNEHAVYYDAAKRQLIFYLTQYDCWGIGNVAGDQGDGLFAYVNSKAELPTGIKGEWKTSLRGKWTPDNDVSLHCEDDGPGLLEQVPEGYDLRKGYLSNRAACDHDVKVTDHWTALSMCWDDPECAGVTHERTEDGLVKTEVYFKSCIEFIKAENWVTFVKNGEDGFQPVELNIIFRNSLNEQVRLYEVIGAGEQMEEEQRAFIGPGEDLPMVVNTGTKWVAKALNNTELCTKTVSLLGGFKDGSLYTFTEECVSDVIAEKMKEKYFEENGERWVNVWPRAPPIHPIWDPVELGYKRTVTSTHHQWHLGHDFGDNLSPEGDTSFGPVAFEMETLSILPKVFSLGNVLSDDECEYLINQTEGKLVRSQIVQDSKKITGRGDTQIIHQMRTSTQTWMDPNDSDVVLNIFYRIGDILQLDRERLGKQEISETLQVVHYAQDQQYRPHHDYFDPVTSADQEHVQLGYNRFATILFYIHPAEEGGGTGFPWRKDGELIVTGGKGDAVLFYSMLEDGNLDWYSKHSGEPVIKGEKFAANLWIWDPEWKGTL